MNKAETEENESDENAIDIESDENVNVSNEIKLNDKTQQKMKKQQHKMKKKRKLFRLHRMKK